VDTITLVERRIDDGRRLIGLLSQKDIDVTAAAWVLTSEDGNWFLYIATEEVDKSGQATAYAKVYNVLRSMAGTCISTSDVKLIGKRNPITKDILGFPSQLTDNYFSRYPDRLLGGIGVEEVYIYPQYEYLRQAYTISYARQDRTNRWHATTVPGELYRNTKAKGAVGYSCARYEGEKPGDEIHGTVAVLLEIGPEFDDQRILNDPNVQRAMRSQAQVAADEMFKAYHPDAVIEHVDDPATQAAAMWRAQARQDKVRSVALFEGGPYDGMKININQINKYCNITPIATKRGLRLFVVLPPLQDWERVVKGEIAKEGPFDVFHCYERKLVPGGAEFHYCSGETISEALSEQ
jgi:hypothetical protein